MGPWVYSENPADPAEERKGRVYDMMREGDWRAVCQEFQGEDEWREPLLVWVRPSHQCLTWIQEQLQQLDISTISSVGCGCGTFEWLLEKATNLKVTGYEVNRMWWESRHSTPHFIHLEYVDEIEGKFVELPQESAALFNYFNNITLFHRYLDNFKGRCVIVMGPVDNLRHCDPEPRYLEERCGQEWGLKASFPMAGGDEIAIYLRRDPQGA